MSSIALSCRTLVLAFGFEFEGWRDFGTLGWVAVQA